MIPEPLLIVELALLGTCTGFLAGLLGIGGGMLMVPFLTMILSAKGFPSDYVVKMAVATSLATICFTSLSSVRAHHQRGAVLWPVARLLAPGILAGAALGSQVAVALPGKWLGILFALFVGFSATQMFLDRKPKPTRSLPGSAGMFSVGGLIGLVSALVGAGGAFLLEEMPPDLLRQTSQHHPGRRVQAGRPKQVRREFRLRPHQIIHLQLKRVQAGVATQQLLRGGNPAARSERTSHHQQIVVVRIQNRAARPEKLIRLKP